MSKRLLLMIVVLLSVVALAGCRASGINTSAALGAGVDLARAATLTDQDIQQLGKQTTEALDAQNTIADADNEYTKRLNTIIAGLDNVDGRQLNYKVYLTKDVNAFAVPDGSVRVYSGLMDLMDDDELYFVIGHEIGHVIHGHSANAYRVAYTTSAARKGAQAVGGVAATLSRSQLGAIGEALINAQFSQSQETQSDEYGLKLMQQNNKDTAFAVSSLRKLASLSGGSSGSSMLSSHPDSNERANHIEAMRNR